MLISRGVNVLRAARHAKQTQQFVRNSSHDYNYRTAPVPPSKTILGIAEGVQGFAWWWILWHLWTEPGHIFGEFAYPDPKKWTDEELGIPPL